MKNDRRGVGTEKYAARRSRNPARSRCTAGMNASTSMENTVGGYGSGSSTVFPRAFLNGFCARSLRRYIEMSLATRCAAARQRRRCALRTHAPRPQPETRVTLRGALQFNEQCRIIVTRQQAEEKPICEPERPRVGRPAELEQAAILEDCAHFLPAHRLRGRGRKQISPPQPGVLLLADDGERFLVMQ